MKKATSLFFAIVLVLGLITIFVPYTNAESATSINGKSLPYPNNYQSNYGKISNGAVVADSLGSGCWRLAYLVYGDVFNRNMAADKNATSCVVTPYHKVIQTTADNLKTYIRKAGPGAVIRVTSYTSYVASDDNGHSMVIIDSDENGAWIYQAAGNGTILSNNTIKYCSWSEIKQKCVNGGFTSNGQYIKYILYPGGYPTFDQIQPAETLEFRNVVYPKTFRIDTTNGWLLQGGTLVSDVNLTSIQSIITRVSDGVVIDNYTKTGLSGKTFAIKSIDTSVKFSKIQTAGNYTWTLLGKDSNNRTVTLVMPFTAVSSGSTVTDKMSMHADAVLVSSIDLKEQETVRVGEKITLTATVAPDDATYKKLNWESSDTSIATVDENGVVTGVAQGSTTITASATDESGQFAVCNITVKPIADTLEFRDVVYPKTFRIDTTHGWFLQGGTLVSDVELTSIQSIITRDSDGIILANYTKNGLSGNTFAIKSIDENVYFNNIQTAGKYTWTLIGKDSNNRTLTLEMPITAVSSGSTVTDTTGTAYPMFIPVSEIVITREYYSLENSDHIGAQAGYRVQVLPSNATNNELDFSIGNELVVSFDDLYQITDPTSAVYGEYYFMLRNIGIGSTTLTVASTDGSNVNATLDFEVVSNITGADVKLQRYIDGELEDIGSFAVEHHRDFFVSSTWYWTFAPGSYEWMFRLDDNSGLRFEEGEAGKMNNSGWLTAEQTGTYNVYIDFYENGQLVPDGCRTIQVEVVPWLISWIDINAEEITLPVGSFFTLNTSMSPTVPTNPNIIWSSSDSGVAIVDEAGVVIAIAPGTATITATAADGGGAEDYCYVTVFCAHEISAWNETEAATCIETGEKQLICDICGEVLETQAIPALGHEEVTNAAVAATCTATGLTEGKHCERCNTILVAQQTVPALGHKEVTDAAVAATCTETGLTEGKHCSRCDAVLVAQQTVSALGHVEVTDAAVAATCTETGLTAGKHCSRCNTVLVAQETVPALGHEEVTDEAEAPTCTETGLTAGKHCSRCEAVLVAQNTVPALGHVEVTDPAVAATCTETGLTAGKHCSRCEAVLVAQNVVPALGHVEVTDPAVAATCTETGLTAGKHCSRCEAVLVAQNVVPALGHVEVTDPAVAATCTETGLTAGKHCSRCEAVLMAQNTVPALGHVEVTDPAVAATCTETGLTAGKHCSRCNTVLVAQNVVPDLGHVEVTDSAVAATCTETGLTAGKHCSRCEAVLVAQNVVPALGHVEVTDPAVAATCTETGLTAGKHCSRCEAVLVAQNVVPALGHVEVTDPAVAATCTETGLTAGKHCSRCEAVLVAQNTVPALGHVEVTDPAVAATCTETGLTAGKHCSRCEAVLVAQNVVPALGHVEVTDPAVAATCTKTGLTAGKHCSRCNTVLVAQQTVPALGHVEVTDPAVAATCTETGLTEGKHCSRCDAVLVAQQTGSALGHKEVTDAAVAATCTETGLTEGKHCERCNAVLVAQQTVPALGHKEVTDAAVAATCTETGLTEGKHCERCNAVLVAQQTVPALGHKEVTDAAVAATCTETGLTEGKHCERCNAVFVAQQTVPALGHEEVTDAAVAATCTETGLTEGKHCERCNTILVAQQTVPALGHKEVTDAAVAATCTETGLTAGSHCERCGTVLNKQETIPPSGHEYAYYAEEKPTCTEPGITEGFCCKNCGLVITGREAIPAAGHSIVVDEAVEPTCMAVGWTEGTHCSVCGLVMKEQESIPMVAHQSVMDASVMPTCTTEGLTAGFHCKICGTVFVEQQKIAALGHDWGEISYTWTPDNLTVTAKHVCNRDTDHVETEQVFAAAEIIAPTDSAQGAVIYSSQTFKKTDFEIQTKTIIIPALSQMKTLKLPVALKQIEPEAFSNLTCQAVIIPEGCTFIGSRAFADCASLLYVRIPASVTYIADDAFAGSEQAIIDRTDE